MLLADKKTIARKTGRERERERERGEEKK